MRLQGYKSSLPNIFAADLRDRLLCSVHDDLSYTKLRRVGISVSLGTQDLHFGLDRAITGQHPEKSQIYYCLLSFSS